MKEKTYHITSILLQHKKKEMASKKQNFYCDKAFELSGIKLTEYKVLKLEQSTFFLMSLMKIISVFLGNTAPIMDFP